MGSLERVETTKSLAQMMKYGASEDGKQLWARKCTPFTTCIPASSLLYEFRSGLRQSLCIDEKMSIRQMNNPDDVRAMYDSRHITRTYITVL